MTDEFTEDEKQELGALLGRVEAARRFPTNTDAATRHVQIAAETLAANQPYPMFDEDRASIAASMLATVAMLYEARARIEALEAAINPFAELFEASEASATKRGVDPTKLPDEQVAISFENVPPLTVGLFRRARAALSQTSKPEGETR